MDLAGRWARAAIALALSVGFIGGWTHPAGAQTGGRPFSSDEWTDRIPLLIGAIIVVLLVNGTGMLFVARSRRRERGQPQRKTAPLRAAAATETVDLRESEDVR